MAADPLDPNAAFAARNILQDLESRPASAPLSANSTISDVLSNNTFQDVNAVVNAEKTSGYYTDLHKDLNEMNYFEFASKYGTEAANNRHQLLDGRARRYRAERAEDRSAMEMAEDTYARASIETGRMMGNLGVWAGSAIAGKEKAAEAAAWFNNFTDETLARNLSKELQEKQYFDGIHSQLQQEETQRQYDADVANGDSSLYAGFKQVGRDFLNAADRVTDSPALMTDIVASGIGSLGPSVGLAKGGSLLASKLTSKATENLVARRVAAASGAALGAASGELASVYVEAASDVMSMDTATLIDKSPIMQALISEGDKTPEEAKALMAGMVAETATLRQLGPTLALSFLTSKFEAAPLGFFAETGVTKGLLKIVGEGFEEAGQEFMGTINKNMAIEEYANVGRRVLQGAGESAALGAIGGLGTASALGTATGIANAPSRAVSAAAALLQDPPKSNDPLRDSINNGPGFAGQTVRDAASNIGSAIREGVQAVGTEIAPAAAKVADVLEDVSPQRKKERAAMAEAAEVMRTSVTILNEAIANDSELNPITKEILTRPDPVAPSAGFADVIDGSKNIVSNVTEILTKMADRSFKMTDDDALYAATQFIALKGVVNSTPQAEREFAGILDRPEVTKVLNRAMQIDMNKDAKGVTIDGAITPEEVATTAAVARVNPANVNPDRVDRILKESGENLSEEDVQYMRAAQKVARAINEQLGDTVRIEKEKNIQLQSIGKKPEPVRGEDPKTAKRSVLFDGYQNKANKKLPSVNDYAAQIMQALQSPDGTTLDEKGQIVQLNTVIQRLKNLVTHYNRKVEALNNSYDQNTVNQNGEVRGPNLGYAGLNDQDNFVSPDQWRNTVAYHRGSPGSVAFAKQVQNELNTIAGIYQSLAESFPEQFTGFELDPLVQLKVDAKLPTAAELQQQPTAPDEASDTSGVRTEEPVNETNETETTESQSPTAPEAIEDSISEEPTEAQAEVVDEENVAEIAEDTTIQETASETTETTDAASDVEETTDPEDVIREEGTGNEAVEEPAAPRDPSKERLNDILPVDSTSGMAETWVDVKRSLLGNGSLDNRINPKMLEFVEKLYPVALRALTRRLQQVVSIDGKKTTLIEHAKDSKSGVWDLLHVYGAVALVMPEGKIDGQLLIKALMGMMDELVQMSQNDPHKLKDRLERKSKTPLTLADLTEEQHYYLSYGLFSGAVKRQLGSKILKFWGRKVNGKATLGDTHAIHQGLGADLIEIFGKASLRQLLDPTNQKLSNKPLYSIQTVEDALTQKKQNLLVINPEELLEFQRAVASGNLPGQPRTFSDAIFADSRNEYSLGTPPAEGDGRHQGASPKEKKALRKMESTPHFLDFNKLQVFEMFSESGLKALLGFDENFEQNKDDIKNKMLKLSKEGQNQTINFDYRELQDMLLDLKHDPSMGVYYKVDLTKVKRHQYQGMNPQNNKLIRALITPTWADVDFSNKQHMAGFWLGVAQASGLHKIEKKNHGQILQTVQEDFAKLWGPVKDLMKQNLMGEDVDPNTAFETMQQIMKDNGIQKIEPQILSAIFAVAEMELAREHGAKGFRTSLSVELDGLTNGAANMLVNYGQGEIDPIEAGHLNRIGYFFGKLRETVNNFYRDREDGTRAQDLYEAVAEKAANILHNVQANPDLPQWKKNQTAAAMRLAAHFGDFKMVDGQPMLTRSSAKNPMTKVNYGSGVVGVGSGIAADMILEFYTRLQGLEDNQDINEYFNYAGDIRADFKALGLNLPAGKFNGADFEFTYADMKKFKEGITFTIGNALTAATRGIMHHKIIALNDRMVFLSNVQARFLQLKFDQMLKERLEELANDPNSGVKRNKKTGAPILRTMPREEYDKLIKDVKAFAPTFTDDDSEISLRSFDFVNDVAFEGFSRSLSGGIRAVDSTYPTLPGVKFIPYTIIGGGDAMMMNNFFSRDDAPDDVLGIFDGLDVPVTKLFEYGPKINEAVAESWQRDLLGTSVNAMTRFESIVSTTEDADLLQAAFDELMEDNKKDTVFGNTFGELLSVVQEQHRQNVARKKALKLVGGSVDQMGGSANPYVSGTKEFSTTEVNAIIAREQAGLAVAPLEDPVEEVKIDVHVSTAHAVGTGTKWTPQQAAVWKIIEPMLLKNDVRIVFGTMDQINKWRAANLPDNGGVLNHEAKGMYDARNKVIFINNSKDNQTVLHEMVHAATFEAVLEHYEGKQSDAVANIEELMNEFLELESKDRVINEAKGAILRYLAETDAYSKAAAVNEFMAYALANTAVRTRLQKQETTRFQKIAEAVVNLMRKLMGKIPVTMFDHLAFNTKVLIAEAVGQPYSYELVVSDTNTNGNGGANGNGNGNTDGGNGNDGLPPPGGNGPELTPSANNYTNKWIQLIQEYIRSNSNNRTNVRKKKRIVQVSEAKKNANEIIESFQQVGLLRSPEARATFRAIYMILNSEMKLNSNAVIALQKLFSHIDDNLAPSMFSGPEANQEYSAILSSFRDFKKGDQINAMATMFALSQTSEKFRAALAQIPNPDNEVDGNLSNVLERLTHFMMSNITASLAANKDQAQQEMDVLADLIVDYNTEREYWLLRKLGQGLNYADKYVSGKLTEVSDFARDKNQDVQASTRSKAVKHLSSFLTLGTNMLSGQNAELTAEYVKIGTHSGVPHHYLVPVREIISEFIGTDKTNKNATSLLDRVNYGLQGLRQAFREGLPSVLAEGFKTLPEVEKWKAMHKTLGQTDFSLLVNPINFSQGMVLLTDIAARNQRILQLETQLGRDIGNPAKWTEAQAKAQQLADYMLGKGAGTLLARNVYAISESLDAGTLTEAQQKKLDQLVSLYALDQMDASTRDSVAELYRSEPDAVKNLVTYLKHLNEQEEAKNPSKIARLNAEKGYIPNFGKKGTQIIIAKDSQEKELKQRGFTKLKSYQGDEDSVFPRSYYITNTRQKGAYSQGVMQNIASTYRGVDMNTGLAVHDKVTGYISGNAMISSLLSRYNSAGYVTPNAKETLVPVLGVDDRGRTVIVGFQRAVNPDLLEQHLERPEHLAVSMGEWAGRQIEESLATEYNVALVDELKKIWDNRAPEETAMFIDLKDTDDPVYAEAYRLIPPHIKDYIEVKFGNSFMVRADMANLSVGYREFSLADVWSGKTRIPKDVQRVMKAAAEMFGSEKTMKRVVDAEELWQGGVSTAKDIIVIRSLIVPLLNSNANVLQLATRGVPVKQIWRGIRSKLGEVEQFNKNEQKKIQLQHQKVLNAGNSLVLAKLDAQIQAIEELNRKMSIAPMIAAGQYKQLSEGITDLDIQLSQGKFGDLMEELADKLPDQAADIAKWGLVSKSTGLYKVANRATQYGDFLAKSIYYDHLIEGGLSEEAAVAAINEEFVNFSVLPGRSRSYLESVGATWFMAFKIRIAKIAANQMRENPLRAMIVNGLTDVGSPIEDNIFSVLVDGDRFDYATGLEMLFDAPGLNPWVNLLDG